MCMCVRVRASVGEHACAVQSRWFTTVVNLKSGNIGTGEHRYWET